MTESHDPMCQVPLSYLTMLHQRGDGLSVRTRTPDDLETRMPREKMTWEDYENRLQTPNSEPKRMPSESALQPESMRYSPGSEPTLGADYQRILEERDAFAEAIATFEFRAGCKLEHIPVEELGRAQDAYVSQQAIDTLKASNAQLERDCNRAVSEMTEWRGKFRELQREKGSTAQVEAKHAPYGFTKAGVPRKKPGPPSRKRKAA